MLYVSGPSIFSVKEERLLTAENLKEFCSQSYVQSHKMNEAEERSLLWDKELESGLNGIVFGRL